MRLYLLACFSFVACSETAPSTDREEQVSIPPGESQEPRPSETETESETEAEAEAEPQAPYITTLTPQLQLIYETQSTRRCPVRDAAFFPQSDQVVVVGQQGVTFVADGQRTAHTLPEPLYALDRDGPDLVAFGRYGMIARLRHEGDAPATVTIEGEHLSLPRPFLYTLQRQGDVLRAISPGIVLRSSDDEWTTEAQGYADVLDIVGQPLLDEMLDARHYGRVYDSASDAMAEFSEDGATVTFRGFGPERTLTLPDSLAGVPTTKGGAFSGGHFAAWSGRLVGRLVDDAWQLFEMPADVESVVSTPGKPLLVHSCQHVWLVTPQASAAEEY
jgi:hypothetical protein